MTKEVENITDEKLLNIREAAAYLGVSVITIWRLLGTKNTPKVIGCYRMGRRVLISKEKHLNPFLKQCEEAASETDGNTKG